MSQQTADGRESGRQRISLKWVVGLLVVAVVIMAVAVITVVLVDRQRDAERSAATEKPGAVTAVTSPYDFTERPTDSSLAEVADFTYVSILLADAGGQLTSYGLSSGIPAAQALSQAVQEAEEVGSSAAPSTATPGITQATVAALGSTLTFMLPDRNTLTFDLYVQQGLIARAGRTWRVAGDLAALIEAAVGAGR